MQETIQTISEYDAYERYDNFLDETYGDVNVCGMEYPTSRVLKDCDPIAYRMGFNDWLDSEDLEIE